MADSDSDHAFELFRRSRQTQPRSGSGNEPLVAIFLPDIHDIAAELESSLPEDYELSDLLGAGVAGLLELIADPSFAPTDADEFIGSAINRIETAVRTEHEQLVRRAAENQNPRGTGSSDSGAS